MGDTTQFQVYVYACPDNQRAAAAEVLSALEPRFGWTEPDGGHRYLVTNDTLNTDGNPIKAGQAPLTIGDFPTREVAEQFTNQSGHPDDYSIDEVPGVDLTEAYTAHEVSVGIAHEYASELVELAPGCSFVLWESPAYEWLGSLVAYTPALGQFGAECTDNGDPVYDRGQIADMVGSVAAGDDLAAHIHRATGGPWFDDWKAAQS